jgi:2-alkenal reductase
MARLVWIAVLSLLLGAAAGAAAGGLTAYFITNDDAEPTTLSQNVLEEESPLISAIQQAMPSVVAVLSQDANTSERLSLGSGVVINERGYIVTNEHVIRGATRLTAILANGEERPAQIVGHDAPFTDLAVLKIADGSLKAIEIGDSAALVLGQRVSALGNSLHDFKNGVTIGVVSGTERRFPRDNIYMEDLIQTDAAVNPGNSGGALINTAGQLVGIPTTVVRSDTGQEVEGIAFAISSRTVLDVANQIISNGRVARPYLGVVHQDLFTPDVGPQLGLTATRGAVVTDVTANSPAAAAGIRRGDVILRIGQYEVTPEMPFLNVLRNLRPNQRVDIVIDRRGERLTLPGVTLGG